MRRQKCKASIPEFFLSIALTITFILIPLSLFSNATLAATEGVSTSLSLMDSWPEGTNTVYKYSVTVNYTHRTAITSWEATVALPYAGTITNFWSNNNISYSLSGTTLTLTTTDSASLSRSRPYIGIGFIISVPSSTPPTPTPTSTPVPTATPTIPIETTAAPTAPPIETIAPPIETTAAVTVAANTPTPSPTPKPKKTPTPKPTEVAITETIAVTEPSETTLATEVAVIDATLDTSATETTTPTPSPTPLTGVLGATIVRTPTDNGKDPFNWLPIIITGFVLVLLAILIKREKDGKKTPVFSPIAEQVSDSWKNKIVPAVSGLKERKIPFINQAKASPSTAMQSPPIVNEPYAAAARFRPIPKAPPVTPTVSASATITNLSAQKDRKASSLPPTTEPSSVDPYAAAARFRPIPKAPPVTTPPAQDEPRPVFLPPPTTARASSDPYAAARGLRPPTKVDLTKQDPNTK